MDRPVVKVAGVDFATDPVDDSGVTYTDKAGNVLKYRLLDGINISYFFQLPVVKKVNDFQFRPDDVYLPGYLRTGTNWTNEMLCMLVRGKAETIPEFKPHIEIIPDQLNELPSPRVLNAHMPMSRCPPGVLKNNCKIVYTLRDPKDVVVSLFKLLTSTKVDFSYYGTFEGLLHFFLGGKVDFNGYLQHWLDAERFSEEHPDIPFYFQIYEHTIQKPVESVQKLSDFLGLPRNDDLCKAIADKCQFSNMAVDKRPFTLQIDGVYNLFRQGTTGDWRNYFTDDMLDYYYKVYDEKMAGSRFYNLYSRKQ